VEALIDGRSGELRSFLRAMRARIDPRDVGLPVLERRRRRAGLRIEEAAVLADVGLTWYSALESGKDIRVSAKLLDRVARALRMSGEERAHLFALALPGESVPAHADSAHLDAIATGFTIGPAFICDRAWNVRSSNRLADRVYGHDVAVDKNLLARMMLDPAFRALHEDWEEVARRMIGMLHLAYGRAPGDVGAISLIERLSVASPTFVEWWNDYRLRDYEPAEAVLSHPTLGRLRVLMTSFVATSLTGRQPDTMVVLQPPLDDETRDRFASAMRGEA